LVIDTNVQGRTRDQSFRIGESYAVPARSLLLFLLQA